MRDEIILNGIISNIQLGGLDVKVYLGYTLVWPRKPLDGSVLATEDNIPFLTEDSALSTAEGEMHYIEIDKGKQ